MTATASHNALAQMVADLGAQQAELDALLVGCDARGWHAPTRCEGWDVYDVVLHLAQTNELAIASATDRFNEFVGEFAVGTSESVRTVDDAADDRVAAQRGAPDAELFARWQRSTGELCAALLARDASDRVRWVAGQLSVLTLSTTRIAETWIHTGDVAGALGVELAPSDRLRHIARLAWRTLPYAFAQAGRPAPGPVAFRLTGPRGDAWTFDPEGTPTTVISGPAVDLCALAARRVDPADTALVGEGPDATAVLELVRTYA
jgi:uncharacterized protein (TIGR03084 family)